MTMYRIRGLGFVLAAGAWLASATGAGAQSQTPVATGVPHTGGSDAVYDTSRNNDLSNNALNREVRSEQDRSARQAPRGRAGAASSADLVPGAPIHDAAGTLLGTVASVGTSGVVVAAGGSQVAVPPEAFGKDRAGLMLAMKKAQFDALVTGASADAH